MKKEMTLGTPAVPAPRTSVADKIREQFNKVLPADCQIKTARDAWYVSAAFCTCVTFIFPPAIAALVYCVIQAKKGGER